jgi:hypothetical protein
MKFLLTVTFTFFYTLSFSQTSDSQKIDTTFSYEVKIPSWLHQFKFESTNLFGGTLPVVNGIENAIVIESFKKTEFKSFDDFKFIFLTGNTFGKPAKFDKSQIWYGQNKLIEIANGVKQRIFIY